jgi:GNAT superfamily N-acetyltransferase
VIQEDLPARPNPSTLHDDYAISYETLVKLGHGDAMAGRRLLRVLIDVEMTHEPVRGPASRPATVRIATERDEPALMELLRLDHAESAAMVAPFDEVHAQSFLYAATRERLSVIGVVDEPEGPVGMVYLINECWWFSPTWHVAERLLFVHPAHRRSRHGRDLLQFAQSFVDGMSAELGYTVYLISAVIGTRDVDRKAAMYGRMMTRGGGVYIHPSPSISRP